MRHILTDTFRELLRTFARPFDPYHPELHYMRGPGPKCRAKRTERVATNVTAADRVAAEAHA
jgi:hypothetical protein